MTQDMNETEVRSALAQITELQELAESARREVVEARQRLAQILIERGPITIDGTKLRGYHDKRDGHPVLVIGGR